MGVSEVAKFKIYLQKHLVTHFSMSPVDAEQAVKESAINTLLLKDPSMVMHDSIESWSDDVYNEFQSKGM